MSRIILSGEAGADDLAPLALAINEIVRLPVTMRSQKCPGVRVEKGRIIDRSYSGPVLEEVILTGKSIRTTPNSGPYRGIPVSVAPIVIEGRTALAIGIVDVIGTIDIPEVFGAYGDVLRQVSGDKR